MPGTFLLVGSLTFVFVVWCVAAIVIELRSLKKKKLKDVASWQEPIIPAKSWQDAEGIAAAFKSACEYMPSSQPPQKPEIQVKLDDQLTPAVKKVKKRLRKSARKISKKRKKK